MTMNRLAADDEYERIELTDLCNEAPPTYRDAAALATSGVDDRHDSAGDNSEPLTGNEAEDSDGETTRRNVIFLPRRIFMRLSTIDMLIILVALGVLVAQVVVQGIKANAQPRPVEAARSAPRPHGDPDAHRTSTASNKPAAWGKANMHGDCLVVGLAAKESFPLRYVTDTFGYEICDLYVITAETPSLRNGMEVRVIEEYTRISACDGTPRVYYTVRYHSTTSTAGEQYFDGDFPEEFLKCSVMDPSSPT